LIRLRAMCYMCMRGNDRGAMLMTRGKQEGERRSDRDVVEMRGLLQMLWPVVVVWAEKEMKPLPPLLPGI